jgi:hypothetical protein
MVRSSVDPGARNRMIGPVWAAVSRTSSWRLSEGGFTTDEQVPPPPALPEYARVDLLGAQTRALYSSDGLAWMPVGGNQIFDPPPPPLWLVGVPLSVNFHPNAWVDVEWFRIRKYARPEPSTSLDAEHVQTH